MPVCSRPLPLAPIQINHWEGTIEKQTGEGVDKSKVCNVVLLVEIFIIQKHCFDWGI